MSDIERILMECRYLLSLNKTYNELAGIMHVSVDTVYHDLNYKLKNYDSFLYQRVNKYLHRNKYF